jgi:cell division protein FtsQ
LLRLTGGWRGSARQSGRGRRRGGVFARLRLSRAWRAATLCFLVATAVYGIAVGGYVQRAADYAAHQAQNMVVRAGFAIEQLTIEGQERTSDRAIVTALGLDSNQSMFSFDSAAAKERLQELPWVRHAQVMRLLPARLHIVIEERIPFAVWQHDGETRLIDSDGVAIAPVERAEYSELPLVVGAGAPDEAQALFAMLAEETDLKQRLRAAVRVAERRWNLKLDNGVEIRLPEDSVAAAITKLDKLEQDYGVLSDDIAAVDLRIPGRVTVRPVDSDAQRDTASALPHDDTGPPGQDT